MAATQDPPFVDVSSRLCRWCQSIFVGPLGPQEIHPDDSIRIDSWQYGPDTPLPPETSVSCDENSDTGGSTASNLPAGLDMFDHRFNHLFPGFEDSIGNNVLHDVANWESKLLGPPAQLLMDAHPSVWKRYGTHHGTALSFLASAMSGCVICATIRSAIGKASDAFLVNTSAFDTGFTTYGLYHFPQWGTCWVIFHLGLASYVGNITHDTGSSILEFLCRPPRCKCCEGIYQTERVSGS